MALKLNKKGIKAILLFGPTASGKSKLAEYISKKINCEILNADSMQVYKEFKILSARPLKNTSKHHLYGFISVKKNFSVGEWYKLANKKVNEINLRGRVAIIVGGTGLYFKALTDGLVEIPLAKKINIFDYNKNNFEKLKMRYIKKNSKIFDGIMENDTQRILRSISIFKTTGMSLKEWQIKKNRKYFKSSDFVKICLSPPKKELEKIIEKRFNKMLELGALEEVKNYKKKYLNLKTKLNSNNIIGLYEIIKYFDKTINLKQLKEMVLIRTRQYAKRQYTWQRGQMKNWKVFKDTNYNDLQKKVITFLSKT